MLERFQNAAHQRQAEKIVAVATIAVREAENGGDLIEASADSWAFTSAWSAPG